MSFYTMAIMGMAPLGSLLAGGLAHAIGAPNALLVSGLTCIAGSIVFAGKLPYLEEKIRPISAQKEFIPEVINGIQSAANVEIISKE